MNLEEATIKALQETTVKDMYNQLDNTKDINNVEGLVDDILVVTDPEVTSEEYDEVIDRAQEIIEDTPEGEIPFDSNYVGQYLLTCPICGTTFTSETMLEPGATCPACMEVPEAFVVKGQVQTDEDVAIDNGLQVDEDQATEEEVQPQLDITTDEGTDMDTDIEDEDNEEESERQVASKEVPQGNKLQETKEEDKTIKTEDTYEGGIFYEIEEALRDAGLNPVRFTDNGVMTNNLGWTVTGEDGTEQQITCDGSYLTESKDLKTEESEEEVETEETQNTTNEDRLPVEGDNIEVIVTENSVGYLLRGLIIDKNNKQFQYVQGQTLPLGKYKRVSKNTMRNTVKQLQDEEYTEYKGKDSISLEENIQYAKFERYQIKRFMENNKSTYGIYDLVEKKYVETNDSYNIIKESYNNFNK